MSFLCYEQLRVAKAQEGFLLGRVDSHVSQHISDSQICNEMTQTVITLSSFLPCTRLGIFYSGAGRLDMAKLKHYLGSHYTELVGWYRNRSSGKRHSLTEAVTHAEGSLHPGHLHLPPCGTLWHPRLCPQVPYGSEWQTGGVSLEIVNIGDTSTQDYVLTPSLTASPAVQDVAARLSGEPGVAEVEDLHQELQKKLQEVLPCLAEALREQAEVMKRVEALRRHCHQTKTAVDFCPGEEVKEGEEETKEKTTAKEATENKIDLINFQEEEEEDVEVVDKEEEVMEVDQVTIGYQPPQGHVGGREGLLGVSGG
ncbi:hypothetical protein O3P69_009149 [Scylla paramamosain]|uniref:Uncharacterized protein n=1 Tax=Scylla paramamosain TaxID=85552 RepID=A0AAW0TAA5_SCYPA